MLEHRFFNKLLGTIAFAKSIESRGPNRILSRGPQANDSDCFSNDWFTGMRFLHLRPMSMDARREWHEDTSSSN
jgi:hypothetical protein